MAKVTILPEVEPSPAAAAHVLPGENELTLLRTADVVRLTKLSRTTVYRLIAGGNMPSVRSGRTVRVPVIGLHRWMAANSFDASHTSHLG